MDDVLQRFKIKSFSTPYSSCRSNVEYLIRIEENQFKEFLDISNMEYHTDSNGKKVLRLNRFLDIENKYDESVMNGFEFTHFDIKSDRREYEKFNRRCKRLLNMGETVRKLGTEIPPHN